MNAIKRADRSCTWMRATVYWLLTLQAALVVLSMPVFRFTMGGVAMIWVVCLALLLGFMALAANLGGLRNLAKLSEAYFLLFSNAVLASFLSVMLAATNRPYVDAALIAFDRRMFGYSWIDCASYVAHLPRVSVGLSVAYSSLGWQPFLLLGLLHLGGRQREGEIFVLAWMLATFVATLVFPFFPALGGYLHYGMPRSEAPNVLARAAWEFEPIIEGARRGTLRSLGEHPIVGLVTFPSFHAAGAIILGWLWRSVKGGSLFVVLNAGMFLSTVPIGGHYLVDVCAGACLGALTIGLARRVGRGSGLEATLSKTAPA